MPKVVGIIEFAWGFGIAIGPIINEQLYNIGGFPAMMGAGAGLVFVNAIVTFFMLGPDIEDKSSARYRNSLDTHDALSQSPRSGDI